MTSDDQTRPEPDAALDPLDAIFPPALVGNPADALALERQAIVDAEIAALAPVTLKPLVPWPHAERTKAACAAIGESDGAPFTALYCEIGPYDRFRLLLDAGEFVPKSAADSWAESAPENPYAAMVRAAVLTKTGWQARGHDTGDTVSSLNGVTFEAFLTWSLELCEQAGAALPGDIAPWLLAQTNAAVLAGRNEVLALAEKWQRIDRFNYLGNDQLVRQLSPKWHGEDGDLLDLARRMHQAPPAHPAHALVPSVLCERYLWEVLINGAAPAKGDDVFRENMGLLRDAYQASVAHPAWRLGYLEGRMLNEFAFCFFYGDQDLLAWEVLQRLGGHMLHSPWNLKFGDGIRVFEDARAWLVRERLKDLV